MNDDSINVEVLVRGDRGPLDPPPASRVGEVERWFTAAGIACQRTTFGLAFQASSTRLDALLGPSADLGADLPIPPELDHLIAQIIWS